MLGLIFLTSCKSEFKPTTFETISLEKSFDTDITATYEKAKGNNELSNRINLNIEQKIIESLSPSEENNELMAVLKAFNSEYVKFKNDFPDASEPAWELNIETELIYQSQEVITIAISTYEFKGGAHGNDQIKFLNLNAQTGDILHLNDIIENEDAFKNLAETFFIKNLKDTEEDLNMEDFFFGESFQLPENIGFSEDGLVLLYNVYEVATYAQGYTEFVIPFEDAEPFFKVN